MANFAGKWVYLLHDNADSQVEKGSVGKVFYTLQDFEDWKDANSTKGWVTKYYKGLGTYYQRGEGILSATEGRGLRRLGHSREQLY